MTRKPSYTENDGLQKCLCRSVSPHCENVLKIFLIFFFLDGVLFLLKARRKPQISTHAGSWSL